MVFTSLEWRAELPVVRRADHWVARAGDRELRLSNLDKIYWPDEGYTKGDLLTYYFNISQTMLPHLIDRPLTRKRMPNGVRGEFFYEKNAPSHTPSWMPTIPVRAENDTKTINYVTVHDVLHMLWIVNLGSIEFHPLHARGADQLHPTYAFFDLDPAEGAGFEQVRYVASLVRVLLDRLGLESYPKTSGATGMQVMLPLDGTHTYDEVRGVVGTISELVHEADTSVTTLEWEVSRRTGKVFLDVNMNREGANIAAAYSARPEPGATVSTPFEWDELDTIKASDHTIETIFARVDALGDPFLPVATGPGQSLDPVIHQLDAKPRKARIIRRGQ
ncbi:MAG: DNA polymerase domain-containing protein [Actinobacteria bacterium]|nr:DNA polymerase domain-containing protein [Actinomycetota bacterium]